MIAVARRWFASAGQQLAAMTLVLVAAAPVHAQTETVEYYALDAIGSVRVVFDADGNIVGRMDYGLYGEPLSSAAGLPSRAYAGLFRDGEAGLDYAQARSYQSRTGRFSTVDPIYAGLFEPQAWNRYAYALAQPITNADPTGLCTTNVCYDVSVFGSAPYVQLYWKMAGQGGYGYSRGGGSTGGMFGRGGGGGGGGGGGEVVISPGDGDDTGSDTEDAPGDDGRDDGQDFVDVCLVQTANLSAGFGDTLTSLFGLTDLLGLPSGSEAARNALGWDTVSANSTAYGLGEIGGEAWGVMAGGAAAAGRAGWSVSFDYYPRAFGAGVNFFKNGVRRLGVDWHAFKLKGKGMVNRPHLNFGNTKGQMKKHWPWQRHKKTCK